MRSVDNDTLIVAVGFAVLFVSLALPMMNEVAEKEQVRQVADRAVQLRNELMNAEDPAQVIKARMGGLVNGLSPDVALADAGHESGDSQGKSEVAVPGDKSAGVAAPGDKKSDLRVVAEWSGGEGAKLGVRERAQTGWSWTQGEAGGKSSLAD